MFEVETSYPYSCIGNHSGLTINRPHVEHLYIYRFNTHQYPYLVEIERYPFHIYAIKFYRRNHKNSKQRYNILSNENKCSRIVGTCFSIFMDIYSKNPYASFGFVGSQTVDNLGNFIEETNETKRFKVYRQAVRNYFGDQTFTHFTDPTNSVYLAVSNANANINHIVNEANKILSALLT